MKITQVCPGYYPYVGGVERVVKNIAEYLVNRNYQITVYTTDPSGKLPQHRMVNGVEVRNYRALAPNEAYYLPHPKMLIHLLREHTDIIHAHSVHALTVFVAYIAHNMKKKSKFVVSPYYHRRGHTKLAQMLWMPYRLVVKRTLNAADAIIVNSRALKDVINGIFKPSCRMFVVYDGIDLNEIKNAKSFILEGNSKILLYVGRLEKYKNIHLAIASMKYLPENYHFHIIGNGPFKPFLENLVQSFHLRDRVHFLGFQPDDIVYRWLNTAHVFIHLSAVESFGMTCIESLAAGTPVIANDDNFGLSETMAMYPKYIKAFRSRREPISKLVRLMMEVAELKPITVDVSQFSWNLIAESMSTIYKQMIMNQ